MRKNLSDFQRENYASDSGYTTPFNDMKVLHELLNNIKISDRDKLLAVLNREGTNY